MKIVSIQVGLPQEIIFRGKSITTGIFKSPIQGPAHVRTMNLDGDKQADLTVHGGRDKAVYAYSLDAYPWWKKMRPEDRFELGAFGENLSVDEMREDKIYIGDTFKIGDAVLQVAQPRLPCYKLGIKFNDISILKMFMKSGRPGVYFRVLKEGLIESDQTFTLIRQEKFLLSIYELFSLTQGASLDPEKAAEYAQIESLPLQFREQFQAIAEEGN
jgi:MOSC domain-containing protein YiiM